MHYTKISFNTVLTVLLMIILIPEAQSQDERVMAEGDRSIRGIEAKADRRFVRQDFDKAMEIYEAAFKNNVVASPTYSAKLHLKIARLYLTLLEYTSAIPHYDAAMALNDDLFNTSDICNYLDALRFSGSKIKAIALARKYAYRDAYNSDRRFQNILHALNYEEGILPIGAPEFNIYALEEFNTINSEFWVGEIQGNYFYAASNSRFHDPHKKFYHRCEYLPIATPGKSEGFLLNKIPQVMQNGPLTVSNDLSNMIITGVHYEKGESVVITDEGINAYRTKLYSSRYNTQRKGWSSFSELFRGNRGYSYSHPFLFNNDKSLLFASDMPGGFGGYDIYVIHWDEEKNNWGLPVNLGAYVNTAGDEITPYIFRNTLIFASNGHIGFGGYDLYGVEFLEGKVTVGSLLHFGYPINTVFNDFNMLPIDENKGYIISDRNLTNKDDIYYFERNLNSGITTQPFGMSGNQFIFSNLINFPGKELTSGVPRVEELPNHTFSERVLSLFFDFDSSELNSKALEQLRSWITDVDTSRIESFLIEGYADEFGEEEYNVELSEKRAHTVGDYLNSAGIDVEIKTIGKGMQLILNDLRRKGVVLDTSWPATGNKPVWLTKEARRVDIIATIK
ncbi:OmpA family protein [Proteiniphilum sp. X52]|uniref:OmpA family protein n=1 Tax=Proteiniphilum sp. X52 TaxID=2382159 RepID=UPI000F0A28A8|nr:OmpA family protein [Proteiniphilum sp. X52]RNC65989.1 OmpA family protein [Proteiniphilum sp. X52]